MRTVPSIYSVFPQLSSKLGFNFFMADRAVGMRGNELIFNIGNIQICNMAIETHPVDGLVAFIFFVLLAFLQLRYPENSTPFHLHPNTIWLSILSFLLYCFFTFSGNLNFGVVNHFQTLKRVFASLSLLCMLVLLLPETWERFALGSRRGEAAPSVSGTRGSRRGSRTIGEWDTRHTIVGSVGKRVRAINGRGKGSLVRVGLEAWGSCAIREWDTWRSAVDSIERVLM
ncbi:hypothetical protein ACSQ67_021307 [Phaseolus vulgaris]